MESTPPTPFNHRPPFQPISMSSTPLPLFDHRQPVRSMPMIPAFHQLPQNTPVPSMPDFKNGPFGLNRSMEEINKQLDWFVGYMNSTHRPQAPSATATLSTPSPFDSPSQSGSSDFVSGHNLQRSSMDNSSNNNGEENQVERLIKGWIAKKLHETDLAPLPLKKGNRQGFSLTQLEQSTVRCLVNVFNWLNQPPSINGLTSPEATFRFNQYYCEKLIAASMYLPGHAKLSLADRYMLANYAWANILAVKNHLTKLAQANSWQAANQLRSGIVQSTNPASDHSTFYDLCVNDDVFCILVAIMIYNPDLVNLQGIEFIRFEQYSYIYLLKRYLEDILGCAERAKMEHYKLIYTTEKIMIIRQQTMYIEQFRRIQN